MILENLFNLLGGNFRMPAAGGAWESQPRSEARHTWKGQVRIGTLTNSSRFGTFMLTKNGFFFRFIG